MEKTLRKIAVSGHQEYWEGYFHAWSGLSENGKAIIESQDGRICIKEAHQIKFIDKFMGEESDGKDG